MRVVEDKWNVVDPQGKDEGVFVKYYYCETCNTLAFLENLETSSGSPVHDTEESLA